MIRLIFVLIRNIINIVSYVLLWPFYAFGGLFSPKTRWVRITLKGGIPIIGPGGLSRWFQDVPTFLQIRRNIKALADDPKVSGVVLDLDGFGAGPAIAVELTQWISALKQRGKRVVAYSDSYSTSSYTVATCANEVVMPPSGRLYTFKPRSEQIFANALLRKIGVFPQFLHIGAFKTASHRFIRASGTTAQRGMTDELLRGMTSLTRERIASQRQMSSDDVEMLFSAPLDIGRARHAGWVDGEVFVNDLMAWIERGDSYREHEAPKIEFQDYRRYLDEKLKLKMWPLRQPAFVALVDLSGFIITPGMQVPNSGPVIDSGVVVPMLHNLRKNPRVVGVLLHIDSPGGSALASDLIWSAVNDLRAEKPVVAWCSNVAASGGYYVAVAAHEIVCCPESIVGSIGVITGKFSLNEAAQNLGISVEVHGDESNTMMSMFSELQGEGLAALHDDTRSFYRRFLQRVGQTRRIAPRRLHRFARGRVYLGEAALERGLVDGVGGFDEAVERLHKLMNRDPQRTTFKTYGHRTPTIKDMIRSSIIQAGIGSEFSQHSSSAATLVKLATTHTPLMLMPTEIRR